MSDDPDNTRNVSQARDTRGANVARIFFGVAAALVVAYFKAQYLYPLVLVHLGFAVLWLALIETGIHVESRHAWSPYIPSALDLAWITIVVYITGHCTSLFILGYFVSNILTSMTVRRNYGLFNAILGAGLFSGTGVLLLSGVIGYTNFFDAHASVPPPAQTIIAVILVTSGLFAVNAIVHGLFMRMSSEIESRASAEERLKAQNEALDLARIEAEKAARAKSNFLANMSHEIRTPMNAVLGMTELLSSTSLDQEQRDYLSVIQRAGDGLLSIINDILDFSSIEADSMKIQTGPFLLDELVKQAVLMMHLQAVQKGLRMEERLEKLPSGVFFLGDAVRIRQVLLNLLSNAVKFTREGTITLEVRADDEQSSGAEGSVVPVHFEVTDTGPGIAPDQRERLFKPFSQLDESSTRRHGGTGLGLAISRRMVEMMGGTIGFHSTLGTGSTFFFDVKLKRVEPAIVPEMPESELSGDAARRIHVLIVDDMEDNRLLLRHLLGNFGVLNIEEARDGEEAVRQVARTRYDLILLDMQMPRVDGYAAALHIRAEERRTGSRPVYIAGISASALPSERQRALESGCSEFLAKPVIPKELYRTLKVAAGLS